LHLYQKSLLDGRFDFRGIGREPRRGEAAQKGQLLVIDVDRATFRSGRDDLNHTTSGHAESALRHNRAAQNLRALHPDMQLRGYVNYGLRYRPTNPDLSLPLVKAGIGPRILRIFCGNYSCLCGE
jgi:hypothetical protein